MLATVAVQSALADDRNQDAIRAWQMEQDGPPQGGPTAYPSWWNEE